jgi:predicted NodU family carbamoyl transferase
VANRRILSEGPFDEIWIQPAAGDAGGSLGVALFIWHQLLAKPRVPAPGDAQSGSLLGPRFDAAEIKPVLDRHGAVYKVIGDEARLCDTVADLLAAGNVSIVDAWFDRVGGEDSPYMLLVAPVTGARRTRSNGSANGNGNGQTAGWRP